MVVSWVLHISMFIQTLRFCLSSSSHRVKMRRESDRERYQIKYIAWLNRCEPSAPSAAIETAWVACSGVWIRKYSYELKRQFHSKLTQLVEESKMYGWVVCVPCVCVQSQSMRETFQMVTSNTHSFCSTFVQCAMHLYSLSGILLVRESSGYVACAQPSRHTYARLTLSPLLQNAGMHFFKLPPLGEVKFETCMHIFAVVSQRPISAFTKHRIYAGILTIQWLKCARHTLDRLQKLKTQHPWFRGVPRNWYHSAQWKRACDGFRNHKTYLDFE